MLTQYVHADRGDGTRPICSVYSSIFTLTRGLSCRVEAFSSIVALRHERLAAGPLPSRLSLRLGFGARRHNNGASPRRAIPAPGQASYRRVPYYVFSDGMHGDDQRSRSARSRSMRSISRVRPMRCATWRPSSRRRRALSRSPRGPKRSSVRASSHAMCGRRVTASCWMTR